MRRIFCDRSESMWNGRERKCNHGYFHTFFLFPISYFLFLFLISTFQTPTNITTKFIANEKQIQKTKTETNTETNTSPPQKPPVGGGTCAEGFARFWEAYPKKVGKIAAEKLWKRLSPDGDLVDRMLEAIELQRRSDQWKRDGGQYIPNPATWLSQGRWEDEAPKAPEEETTNPFLRYLNRLQAEEETKIYADFEETHDEPIP